MNTKYQETIVSTGCLAVGSQKGLIRTSPLGSCVAVIAYDATTKNGGIAHIMLPGKSPNGKNENKYAENAISNLINEIQLLGALKSNIQVCLTGGANVLIKENDFIGKSVVDSVYLCLKNNNIRINKSSLGGFERRSAKLILESGIVNYTIGDSQEKKLYEFNTKPLKEILL